MDDLVPDLRSADRPAFWIMYDKAAISAGNIRSLEEIAPQREEVRFEAAFELSDILTIALAAAEQDPGPPDILRRR